ncbi:hypothetical protein KQX54_006996 [Cotesia glomerata]|uniref:Uncharacterized protein n=1 Tax=Cotesia glomerata TaxID=32391 RepID=A0AAV7IZM9_COTGL|nr:hypothetical protein KQX54_006996 [Cotesia glomerata]
MLNSCLHSRPFFLRCTRACKSCHGETCLNSADIVEENDDDDDDEEIVPEDQDAEGIGPAREFVIKPGYLQIMQGIYGTNSDDSEDDNDNDNNGNNDPSTRQQASEDVWQPEGDIILLNLTSTIIHELEVVTWKNSLKRGDVVWKPQITSMLFSSKQCALYVEHD